MMDSVEEGLWPRTHFAGPKHGCAADEGRSGRRVVDQLAPVPEALIKLRAQWAHIEAAMREAELQDSIAREMALLRKKIIRAGERPVA